MKRKKLAIELLPPSGVAYPMGLVRTASGFHVSVESKSQRCAMLLYKRNVKSVHARLEFDEKYRIGDIWQADIQIEDGDFEYNFENEYGIFADAYGVSFSGRDSFGKPMKSGAHLRSPIYVEEFDWEDDAHPRIPYSDSIFYQLHVRGFTKLGGVSIKDPGTFAAIIQRIDYLGELGVTSLIFQPVQEFDEIVHTGIVQPSIVQGQTIQDETVETTVADANGKTNTRIADKESIDKEIADDKESEDNADDITINYWGYTADTHYFAPKASYCKKKARSPVTEFKSMIKALHANGMEAILEIFFDGSRSDRFVLDVLEYWVRVMHVDGFRIIGKAPLHAIASDPYLSDTKLIADYWFDKRGENLATADTLYKSQMRQSLKSDFACSTRIAYHMRHLLEGVQPINYFCETNGFTLEDLVSYNELHGDEVAYRAELSWNCGHEGVTPNKYVNALRIKQKKNALVLLMLSQGAPMIYMGDEIAFTKKGHNNTYSHDDRYSWIDYRSISKHKELYDFIRMLIAFRKSHKVFHQATEPTLLDTMRVGIPDMSYHGVDAWQPELDDNSKVLGILYSGQYVRDINTKGKEGDIGRAALKKAKSAYISPKGKKDVAYDFYIAINMHWERHDFNLPQMPYEGKWHICIDTAVEGYSGIYDVSKAPRLRGVLSAESRSIVVLVYKASEK